LAGEMPAPQEPAACRGTLSLDWLPLLAFVAACLPAFVPATVARGQEPQPPEIVGLRVGFNEQYKVGLWTPVEVTIRGGGTDSVTGQLELTVADGDGTRSRVVSPPKQLIPGRTTSILMYVKFGEVYGEMNAVFRVDGRKAIDRTFDNDKDAFGLRLPEGLPTDDTLLVTVGGSLGIEREQTGPSYGVAQTRVARVGDVSELPRQWYGYEGVDALVLFTSRSELYSKLAENSPQVVAIDQWVERGGKLVLCVGAQAPIVLSPGAALARFSPGALDGTTTLPRTAALENYSGILSPVPRAGGDQIRLQVPKFKPESVRGVVDAKEGDDLPLVVRSPHVFGQIVFAGVDLDRAPLLNWKGRDSFLRKLLDLAPQKETDQALSMQGKNYGISDLAGQLRGALDQFGIEPISFAQVALLIFVYILLIGPGDYFLVKKVIKRMEWTWATFPAIVAAVSIGAYALAYWTKGNDLRLNQAEVVDVDVESGMVRGAAWLNVFSPRTATYDLSVAPAPPSRAQSDDDEPLPTTAPSPDDLQVLFSWMGNPGSAWGGMDSRRSQPSLFSRQYAFAPSLDAMDDVPIQVWSTKGFTSRYSYRTRPLVSADLTMGSGQVPEGTITSGLPFALRQAALLSGGWAYELNDFNPGDTKTLVAGKQRDLVHVLKDVHLVRDEKSKGFVQTAAPFQPSSTNVHEILQTMMFYKAVGGREYVQLLDGYQRFVDLSALLGLDRAILVGVAEEPAARLVDNGKPLAASDDPHWQHWTYYRFVIPIKPAPRGGRPAE
jgi:hypothetical protein